MPTSLLQRPTVPVLSITIPGASACFGSRPRILPRPDVHRDIVLNRSSVDSSEIPAVRFQILDNTARARKVTAKPVEVTPRVRQAAQAGQRTIQFPASSAVLTVMSGASEWS